MKIKQSTFYALRLIYRIYKEADGVVTSVELAKMEEISQGVTMKILRQLTQVGILNVHQGICGGFSLSRDINEITMLEVITEFEGLDICKDIGESTGSEKKGLLRTCSRINEELQAVLLKYTVRALFEPKENLFSESMPL